MMRITGSVIVPSLSDPDKFIYVKTAKDGKWGFPAGKIEAFEHPSKCAIREVHEEIGVVVELEGLVGIWPFKSRRGNSIIDFVYSGKIAEGIPRANPDEGILDVQLFSLREVEDLYRKGELKGEANIVPLKRYIEQGVFPLNVIGQTLDS